MANEHKEALEALITRERNEIDARNAEILKRRQSLLDAQACSVPRVGDYVDFACGTVRRVSYVGVHEEDSALQTSDLKGGSYYLGDEWCNFSGSLYASIPASSCTLTGERRAGDCWFFSENYAGAGRGIQVKAFFRVWRSTEKAPR